MAAVRLRLSVRLRRVHRSQVDRRVAPCVRENPRKPRVCVCIYALYLLAERVRAQTRLRVLTLDRASVRGIGHT